MGDFYKNSLELCLQISCSLSLPLFVLLLLSLAPVFRGAGFRLVLRVTLAGSLAVGLLSSSALLRAAAQVSAFPTVDVQDHRLCTGRASSSEGDGFSLVTY